MLKLKANILLQKRRANKMNIWIAPSPLHIEFAQVNDAKILAKLHKSAFYHSWPESEFSLMLRDKNKNPCLIACDKNRNIAGFVMLRQVGDEAELLSIITAKKWRKKGIGKALLRATIEHLTMSPVMKFFLEVADDNIAAIKLYNSFGFEIIGKRENYYSQETGKTASALVMALNLD